MKRFAIVFLAFFLLGSLVTASAAQGTKTARRQLAEGRQWVKQGSLVLFSNPPEAQRLFEKAFARALELTPPDFADSVREQAFALACQCLHPVLYPQVRIAIDTYLSLYATGRNRKQVLMNKAILEYAEGRWEDGEATLAEVKPLLSSREKAKFQAFCFDGFLAARKYRSAEKFLGDWKAKRPTARVRRDIKRFERGTKRVAEALQQVESGRVTDLEAVRVLRDAAAAGYFAEGAPKADSIALTKSDATLPLFHGQEISWLGKERVIWHRLAAFQRLEACQKFVDAYPEMEAQLRGKALLTMKNLCYHELETPQEAEGFRLKLAMVPGFEGIAKAEALLDQAADSRTGSSESTSALEQLLELPGLFPYDNGYLPVLQRGDIVQQLGLGFLVTGQRESLRMMFRKETFSGSFRGIPYLLFFYLGADLKNQAYNLFKGLPTWVQARDRKMVRDFLFPLYQPINSADGMILGAMMCSESRPFFAIDLLLQALTGEERPRHIEHALALLTDFYQTHRNYIEAQSVWATLRSLYPKSVWIR